MKTNRNPLRPIRFVARCGQEFQSLKEFFGHVSVHDLPLYLASRPMMAMGRDALLYNRNVFRNGMLVSPNPTELAEEEEKP